MQRKAQLFLLVLPFLFSACGNQTNPGFKVIVECEETVYTYESANNDANPMWCHGNTSIVRYGDTVFAAGLETLKDVKPLHNTRWTLYKRDNNGWSLLLKDEKDRTREPSPLGLFSDGKLFLSANPTLTPPDTYSGPAEPRVLQFSTQTPDATHKTLLPVWQNKPAFTEHSYRSFAADGPSGELILFQNIGYTHAEWSFYDKNATWSAQGQLNWPWGADYEKPCPIRVCYPAVQLFNREVHFVGVSDIMEPNKEWKDYKFKLTNRKWDYDFRRLFYTWSSDITTGKFHDWIEIASREKTGGNIRPCDLWRAPDGHVHILWTERALDERLRQDFFPDEKQSHALNYAVLKDGRILLRKPIMLSKEGEDLKPGRGRFQVTPDNRLFVFYHVYDKNINENRLIEIQSNFEFSPPVKVDLQRPFTTFFTATVRGGSLPSDVIDVFGQGKDPEMRYAKIRILKE